MELLRFCPKKYRSKVSILVLFCHKILLIFTFLAILVLTARLLDAITWHLTDPWPRPLSPMALSVAQLRAILEWRGIQSERVVEKSDLAQLVTQSGPVNRLEESVIHMLQKKQVNPDVHFDTCGQYYHQVEQQNGTNASYWLVHVKAARNKSEADPDAAPRSEKYWTVLRKDLGLLGVRTGVLDCNLDPQWCFQRKWRTTGLVFVSPQADEETVATRQYSGQLAEQDIKLWIAKRLDTKLPHVKDMRRLKNKWLSFINARKVDPDVRVVMVTPRISIPMQFFALRLKETPRVELGILKDAQDPFLKWVKDQTPHVDVSLPLLLFITRNGWHVYGQNADECFDRGCVNTFLALWYPSSGQVFFVAFVLAFVVALFDAFPLHSESINRVFYSMLIDVSAFFVCSCFFSNGCMQVIHTITTSETATIYRKDLMFYLRHPYVLAMICPVAVYALQKISTFLDWRGGVERLRLEEVEELRQQEEKRWGQIRAQRLADFRQYRRRLKAEEKRREKLRRREERVRRRQQTILEEEERRRREEEEQRRIEQERREAEEIRRRIEEFFRAFEEARVSLTLCRRPPPNYLDSLPTWRYSPGTHGNRRSENDRDETDDRADRPDEDDSTDGQTESDDDGKDREKTDASGFLCVICQFDVEMGQVVCGLPNCSHTFHADCIKQWLTRGRHVCPVCIRDSF